MMACLLVQVVTANYLIHPNQSSSSSAAIAEVIAAAAPVNYTSLQVSSCWLCTYAVASAPMIGYSTVPAVTAKLGKKS